MRVAAERGFATVGLADWCSVAGAVELSEAAREAGLQAVVGVTLPVLFPAAPRSQTATEAFPLVLLAKSREGYARLCELITHLNMESPDGVPLAVLQAVAARGQGQLTCLTGGRDGFPSLLGERQEITWATELLRMLRTCFPFDLYVGLYHGQAPNDRRRVNYLRGLARDLHLPVVAAPQVCLAEAADYPLLDALMCARLGVDTQTPHAARPRNDSGHVGTPQGWAQRLPFPDALLNAEKLARECALDLLPERLHVPEPLLQPAQTAQDRLEERVFAAVGEKYPSHRVLEVDTRLRQELATVRSLDLAGFFLTAAEIGDYCRSHGILAAARGSAAGSVLCFLLGLTLFDPLQHGLLFERFLHTGKTAMPDVDIDIASARRDQVLAWVEERWGLDGSGQAMVANRVTYRLPSAIQDLGRALGLPEELRTRLTHALGRDHAHLRPHRAREAERVFTEVLGEAPVKETLLRLLTRMEPRLVRHLAPHSGGVVLSATPLTHYSPLTRSSGGIRMLTVDKDDSERLGLIKLDLLGLRLLGALERAREEVLRLTGEWTEFGELPDDPRVWESIGQGDTMALFQIESPAQLQLAARLQPKNLVQLAHQIALIRPGPIQSDSVHPYVRRARGEEPVPEWPEPLGTILAPTLGVLLFQEQILRIAVRFAGYAWGQADRFRGDLSRAEDEEELARLREPFVRGAVETCGVSPALALEVFNLCAKFRGYGFAESHSHAFAGHCYAGAWLRLHHPAAYLAGVLTESPGMWPRDTLAREARRWGVRLAPACINRSGVSYRAETARVVRVPLTAVEGVSVETARRIVQERLVGGKFAGVEDFYDRVEVQRDVLETLAKASTFDAVDARRNRRETFFVLQTVAHARPSGTRGLLSVSVTSPKLPELSPEEVVRLDLETKRVTETGRHPLDAHRGRLRDLGCVPIGALRHGQMVWTAGSVIARQKPPTARGYAFFVLEDRSGRVQAVISPKVWAAHRQLLRDAAALIVQGEANVRGRAVTLRVDRLCELPVGSRSNAAD
ncbi:error-prone DNA polymerase (plasmid) [Deinococcus aetherius]|uniref:Error-prone DNA polymerase n=1 Tax=Deinococcus aetherius TaxID=200252 RepID=A0ABM8AHM9_9DEIO|nr:error-prone DNA polymerase [Deinococcus aetherius]